MTTPEQWLIFLAFTAIAAGVLWLAALAGAGRLGELGEPITDAYVPELPDRPLTAADLRGAKFTLVRRGYSIDQVDRLLQRAAESWQADADGV